MGETEIKTSEPRIGMISTIRSYEYAQRSRAMKLLLATVALVGKGRRMFDLDEFVADLSGIPLGDVGTARRLSYSGPRELIHTGGDKVNPNNPKAVEASLAETIQLKDEVSITREQLAEDVERQLTIEGMKHELSDRMRARLRPSDKN